MKHSSISRSIALLMSAVTVICLASCGSKDKADNTPSLPTATPQSSGSEAPMTSENAQNETASTGFVFIHNGIRIDVDAEASSIVQALGAPVSYFEAASCVFNGLDKMYTYGGFELDTYPTDGKDYVSAVIFRDDSVATPEGIMIGDSAETLRQVYGEPTSADGNLLIYGAGNMELCFILENDAIAAIEYLSIAALG